LEPRADDDGTLADLPWASVFDPAANVRALGEIQARGLRAASDVVDRMVRAIDGDGAPDGATTTTGPGGATAEDDRREVDTLVASWATLLRQLVASLGGALGDPAAAGPTLDVGVGAASGSVRLAADGAGPAQTEVWVHNRSADDQGCIRLRCSDLLAHDGRSIPGSAVGFEPAEIPVPPRSSRGVELTVRTPPSEVSIDEDPVLYRGALLVEHHPELWLPVVLTVGAPRG
jgi:hypothetical protein